MVYIYEAHRISGFDQLWQQTCENQILCIVQQIGPELILQFVRLHDVFVFQLS